MRRFRTRFGHVALSVGLLAWLLSIVAAQVHTLRTMHVECDEHGEIVGLQLTGTVHIAPDHDRAQRLDADLDRDHGCMLLGAALVGTPTVAATVFVTGRTMALQPPPPPGSAPRGPPLAYAPKTSPPLMG